MLRNILLLYKIEKRKMKINANLVRDMQIKITTEHSEYHISERKSITA